MLNDHANSPTNIENNSQTNHQNNNLPNHNPSQQYADDVGLISKFTKLQLGSVDESSDADDELLNRKYYTEIERLKILLKQILKFNSNNEFWNKYGK